MAVEDCAAANICGMRATPRKIASTTSAPGRRTSLKEVAERILNLTGSNQPNTTRSAARRRSWRNRIGDPRRASEEIGFTAKIDLDEGLRSPHRVAKVAHR